MDDNAAYWIWLQNAFGAASEMPWRIFTTFPGGIEAFHEGGPRLWNTMKSISEQKAGALVAFTLDEALTRLEYIRMRGWEAITPYSRKYPENLKHISNPPAVLYVKGEFPDIDSRPAIGIAGAREASQESLTAASKFGYQLATGGAVIVSGGAVGVDTQAMMGALSATGRMISVLPVDLDSPYIVKNSVLRRTISERGGALVTEYFSQRSPLRGTFQQRNRLITGLSCGILLIQAKLKSGTIMYAKYASDQNRDVFVYPGPPGAEGFEGSRKLIADGAKAVINGEEILEEYAARFRSPSKEPDAAVISDFERKHPDPLDIGFLKPKSDRVQPQKKTAPKLSDDEGKIISSLEEELSVSQLEDVTGIPASRLLGTLTSLELEGLIESLPGKRYRAL